MATYVGRASVVDALLAASATDLKNKDGKTALMEAAYMGHASVVDAPSRILHVIHLCPVRRPLHFFSISSHATAGWCGRLGRRARPGCARSSARLIRVACFRNHIDCKTEILRRSILAAVFV